MNQDSDDPAGMAVGKADKLKSEPGHGAATSENASGAPESDIDLARLAPQLRGLYRELLDEPIPDRFSKLLEDLGRKESDTE